MVASYFIHVEYPFMLAFLCVLLLVYSNFNFLYAFFLSLNQWTKHHFQRWIIMKQHRVHARSIREHTQNKRKRWKRASIHIKRNETNVWALTEKEKKICKNSRRRIKYERIMELIEFIFDLKEHMHERMRICYIKWTEEDLCTNRLLWILCIKNSVLTLPHIIHHHTVIHENHFAHFHIIWLLSYVVSASNTNNTFSFISL